jgi:hypothetical protein
MTAWLARRQQPGIVEGRRTGVAGASTGRAGRGDDTHHSDQSSPSAAASARHGQASTISRQTHSRPFHRSSDSPSWVTSSPPTNASAAIQSAALVIGFKKVPSVLLPRLLREAAGGSRHQLQRLASNLQTVTDPASVSSIANEGAVGAAFDPAPAGHPPAAEAAPHGPGLVRAQAGQPTPRAGKALTSTACRPGAQHHAAYPAAANSAVRWLPRSAIIREGGLPSWRPALASGSISLWVHRIPRLAADGESSVGEGFRHCPVTLPCVLGDTLATTLSVHRSA